MSQTTGPTIAGFNTFVYSVMAIDPLVLPTDSPIIGYAYNVALGIVNPLLGTVRCALPPPGSGPQWNFYALAVFNLGGSNIVNYAQDQPGRTYFSDLRQQLGISSFQAGVVGSSSDNGTSDALVTPEFMKTLTLQNLQAIKDPWGRQYLSIAQAFGTLWGLT